MRCIFNYQLTSCAKTKLSDFKDRCTALIAASISAVATIVFGVAILTLIGLITNYLVYAFNIVGLLHILYEPLLLTGIMVSLLFTMLGAGLFIMYQLTLGLFTFTRNLYFGLANSIRPLLGKEEYIGECKLFEPCEG